MIEDFLMIIDDFLIFKKDRFNIISFICMILFQMIKSFKNKILASQFEIFEEFLRFELQSLKNKVRNHFKRAKMKIMILRNDDDIKNDFENENN